MKTAKELFERLKTDAAFAKEFTEALNAKREAGAKSYYETIIPAAEERGYAVTKDDIDEMLKAQEADLTPEELGKVAGGTSCIGAVMAVGASLLATSIVVTGVIQALDN